MGRVKAEADPPPSTHEMQPESDPQSGNVAKPDTTGTAEAQAPATYESQHGQEVPQERNQHDRPSFPPQNNPINQQEEFEFQFHQQASPPPPPSSEPASYPPQTNPYATQPPQDAPPPNYPPQRQTHPESYPPRTTTANYPPQSQTRPASYPPQSQTGPASYPPQTQPANYPPQSQTGIASNPPQTQPANYPPQRQTRPASYPPQRQPNQQPYPPSPHDQNSYRTASPLQQQVQFPPNAGTVGWTTDIFDCLQDPENAVTTFFLPCVTFGQIAEIIDNGHTSCGTSGIFYSATCCLLSHTYRTKLRSMYGLVEAPAPDWLTHVLCECCALSQEYRELRNRGLDPALGWIGNKNQSLQQQEVPMVPPINQTMTE